MKKPVLAILLLCISLVLFGCDNAEEAAEPETEQTETTATPESEDTTAKAPTDAEIKALFDRAYDVYQWFELEKLDVETAADGSVVMYEIDGNYCGKVDDPRVASFDELKSIVQQYFSADISAYLLQDGLYFRGDDGLYRILADRGGDVTRGKILSEGVTARTDTSITYTVTVESIDAVKESVTGSEDLDFICEKIGDRWLFTQFQSIY